jgi:hypothetical protein
METIQQIMRINKFDFQVGGGGLVVDNSHKDEEELKKELSKNGGEGQA